MFFKKSIASFELCLGPLSNCNCQSLSPCFSIQIIFLQNSYIILFIHILSKEFKRYFNTFLIAPHIFTFLAYFRRLVMFFSSFISHLRFLMEPHLNTFSSVKYTLSQSFLFLNFIHQLSLFSFCSTVKIWP